MGLVVAWSASRSEPPYVEDLLEEIRWPAMAATVERTGSVYRWRAAFEFGTVSGEAHIDGRRLGDFNVRADHPASRLVCGTGRQVEGVVGVPAPPEPVDQTIVDLLKDPPPEA